MLEMQQMVRHASMADIETRSSLVMLLDGNDVSSLGMKGELMLLFCVVVVAAVDVVGVAGVDVELLLSLVLVE